jgi:hypothetical protein
MEELKPEEVTHALREWLGERGSVEVSRNGPEERITGWIMHPDFTGVSRAIRQSWLWDGFGEEGMLPQWQGLRGTFRDRAGQIGLILTYSPAEYENAFGESAQTA